MKPTHSNQDPPNSCLARTLLAALLTIGSIGCTRTNPVSTTAAGHEINITISGNHSIESHPDQGVIKSPYGTVTIESNRIRVDNGVWTAIPEQSPVEVRISRGMVLLTAGRVTVKRTVN